MSRFLLTCVASNIFWIVCRWLRENMSGYDIDLAQVIALAQSLGIGFLIGLERERHNFKIAGVRSFTLIALAGALSGYIGDLTDFHYVPWVICGLLVTSLLIAQYKSQGPEPDTTSVIAALITFLLGYMLHLGNSLLPVSTAIVVTAILYFREELRGLPYRLNRQDIISFFQFAAVAFILLPILPNKTYGPYQVFNPFQTGWLVVLISGIGLLGYIALRLMRSTSGLVVVGLLGGLVSTTATTLVYARHTRTVETFAKGAATIILLSHLVLFVRISVLVSVVEPALLRPMLPWILGGLSGGLLATLAIALRARHDAHPLPELQVSNPTDLKTALGFALGFTLIVILAAWMNDVFQSAGGYLVAFFSGLTDMDAITIANLKLVTVNAIEASTAVNAVVIAYAANLCFKLGIVVSLGHRRLWAALVPGFAALLVGALGGLLLGRLSG